MIQGGLNESKITSFLLQRCGYALILTMHKTFGQIGDKNRTHSFTNSFVQMTTEKWNSLSRSDTSGIRTFFYAGRKEGGRPDKKGIFREGVCGPGF